MARQLQVDIKETDKDLKLLFKKQTQPSKRERIHALYLLKSKQVTELNQLAQVLGRDTSTLYRWFQRYEQQGLDGLLNIPSPPRKTSSIPAEAIDSLLEKLNCSETFPGYRVVQIWLQEIWGVRVNYHVVYRAIRPYIENKVQG